ncbi:disks large-associated protein 5 [Plakobranchus ocellatus]|uniref:Disks large-associated protein 5 n=1 Tax=Plakobranchus ocellatus TaxID=259542 RepID=A0AAV4BK97_9GAST|nr:disks large-associated protein 5 [Plakobranchus ocellatus]
MVLILSWDPYTEVNDRSQDILGIHRHGLDKIRIPLKNIFEVEDVNSLFHQLKALQDNYWEEKKSPEKLVLKKKPVARKAVKPKGVSNFKAFREEMMMRKAKKAAASTVNTDDGVLSTSVSVTEKEQKQAEQRPVEFDGGFFKVTSPARTPIGKRATLTSHTNATEATQPSQQKQHTESNAEINKSPPKSPTALPQVAADKENQMGHQSATFTPALSAAASTTGAPSYQSRLMTPAKRPSYVPVVPSPLLKDTSCITTPRNA